MKKVFMSIITLVAICSCHNSKTQSEHENIEDYTIQKFEISDIFITFTTLINDTIPTIVILESGCPMLQIDKSFFEKYLDTGQEKKLSKFQSGFASSRYDTDSCFIVKSSPIKIKIGNKTTVFNDFNIFDFKKKNLNADILLPFPLNDSVNIWELNMENKYIKLHDHTENIMRKDYDSFSFYSHFTNYIPEQILFDLPIRYLSSDNKFIKDTFFCMFDTGNPVDILLWHSINSTNNLKKQKLSNGIINDQYIKIFRSEAYFFNSNIKDTTALRFFENPWYYPICDFVGLNFIARFNYFIDLLNHKIYYKQIEKPTRIYFKDGYDVGGGYVRYDAEMNFVVDSIGKKFENDACARAGVKAGDTIIWFSGYSIKEQSEKSMDFRDVVHNYGYYHIRVKRNGDTINLKTGKTF